MFGPETFIVYHDNCYDGWCAAWVALKAMPTAHLVPYKHGDPAPVVPVGSSVYFVDISLPREQMERFAADCNVRVLDHHQTAQAALEGLAYATFDMTKSGAMLTWEYFFPLQDAPTLVKYIQDQDLWTWALKDSRAIGTYIRSFERNIDNYNFLELYLQSDLENAAEFGGVIERAEKQRIMEMCEQSLTMEIAGYTIPVVNASCLFSQVAAQLLEKYPDAPFAGYFFHRGDGILQYGLRSKGDFDVSVVAKRFGGGGHKNAAGFQVDKRYSI